jgi:Transcriptional regulator PadR-like family
LEQISRSVVQVNQGSLYPALHRLEQSAEWKEPETGREAKFYSRTPAGRRQLAIEQDSWARLSGAVNLIFEEGNQGCDSSTGFDAGPWSVCTIFRSIPALVEDLIDFLNFFRKNS